MLELLMPSFSDELVKISEASTPQEVSKQNRDLEKAFIRLTQLGLGAGAGYGAMGLAASAVSKDPGARNWWKNTPRQGRMKMIQLGLAGAGAGALLGTALKQRLREQDLVEKLKA